MADHEPASGGMAHPGLDALADYDAGALDAGRSRATRGHVDGCAPCRESLSALAATRAELGSLAAPSMPADVAERIHSALSEAASSQALPTPVTMLPERQHRRRFTVAGSAAAAVVLLFAGAVVFGATRGQSASHPSTASKAAAPGMPAVVSATGRDYSRAALPEAVPGLLHPLGRAAGAPLPSPQGAAPQPGPVTGSNAAVAPDPHALDRLRNPVALRACLTELSGAATVQALALDYAAFEGEPALVVVLPGSGTVPVAIPRADVYVVGPGCAPNDAQIRYVVRVPRPS
ncbi:MAG: hypothetical protein M3Z02_06750 [Actinomycetota bacterium]|nr:hypothetical protein [Actinomycetota bacterium]